MSKSELAYCAGVIDSDGCVTIKRRNTPTGHTHSPVIFVRQVEPHAIDLLRKMFGGKVCVHKPSIKGGRPLIHWEISHRKARAAAARLLPFMRIKRRHAEILIEFADHLADPSLRRRAKWFKHQKGDQYYTPLEAANLKGMDRQSIYQAVHDGSVPSRRRGRSRLIPKRFWDGYVARRGRQPLAQEYIDLRIRYTDEIRKLNGPTRGVRTADRR